MLTQKGPTLISKLVRFSPHKFPFLYFPSSSPGFRGSIFYSSLSAPFYLHLTPSPPWHHGHSYTGIFDDKPYLIDKLLNLNGFLSLSTLALVPASRPNLAKSVSFSSKWCCGTPVRFQNVYVSCLFLFYYALIPDIPFCSSSWSHHPVTVT